jgi:hypothetical protein
MSTKSSENDEWKLVIHKKHPAKKKSKSNPSIEKARRKHMHSVAEVQSTDPNIPVNQADIQRSLVTIKTFRSRWSESPQAARLQSEITSRGLSVSTAIIAGLGNLDPTAIRDRFRASWQLAIFLEIISSITQNTKTSSSTNHVKEIKVPIYAQDPAFTSFDKALLSSLNITVLPGSEAINKSDGNTFLFVPFVDAVVLLPELLKDRDPIVYVGSDICEVVERMGLKGYAEQ